MISKEAKRKYDIKYREKHKEQIKKVKAKWRKKNKKKLNAWVSKWRKSANGKESIKKWRDKSPKHLRGLYIQSAKKRGISFAIPLNIFEKLINQECIYCGKSAITKRNGIDRIDNNKGYEIDNIVSCCFKCNQMKGKLSVEDFLNHIGRIIEYGIK